MTNWIVELEPGVEGLIHVTEMTWNRRIKHPSKIVNIGDEVVLPGGDLFSKAITKLWAQNYFSDVEIYITKLEDKNMIKTTQGI